MGRKWEGGKGDNGVTRRVGGKELEKGRRTASHSNELDSPVTA